MNFTRALPGRYTASAFALVAVLMLALPALFPIFDLAVRPVQAQAADWIVDKPGQTLNGQIKELSKNLIVETGGGLTITNCTLLFNLTKDASAGIMVQPGGILQILDSRIYSKNPAFMPTFTSSGELTMIRTTVRYLYGNFQNGGGVLIKGGVAHISDSDFESNKRQGVTVFDGTVTIQRNTFTDNMEGVQCKEVANVNIEDNQFLRSTDQGITAVSCIVMVQRNTFTQNDIGIGLSGTSGTILGNTISSGRIGIDVSNSNGVTLSGNKITSNHDVGLRLTASQVTVTGNQITSNGGAINATGGSLSISSNNITNNKQGLRLVDAIGTVSSNTIGGQTGYGIYILGGSFNGTTTNTFNPNNGEGRVAWAWDLLIKTSMDTSNGLIIAPNAEVQVYDADNNIVFSGVTNSSGQTKLIEIVQKQIDNTGTEVVLTPHTLKASSNSTSATQKLNMSQNQTVMLVLGKKPTKGLPIPQLLLAVGVILICIAVGLALNWKFKSEEEGPEPRIKREASRRRRGRRRALTSTSTSRSIRARRHKRRD